MLKFSKRLLFIIIKNLKIVFRSWTSILLLILGPMLLILILGFAFQGDELHDINMGVYSTDYKKIDPLLQELQTPEMTIHKFKTLDSCILAMNLSTTHLCVEFTQDFEYDVRTGNAGSGQIIFYYDNSRYNLIKYILDYLNEKVALTSQAITLEATQAIFSDVGDFVAKMQTAQQNLTQLRKEVQVMRLELLQLKVQLQQTQDAFEPKYLQIKGFQDKINKNQEILNDFIEAQENLNNITDDLENIQNQLDILTIFILDNEESFTDYTEEYNDRLSDFIDYVILIGAPIPIADLEKLYLNTTIYDDTLFTISDTQLLIDETIDAIQTTGSVATITSEQTLNLLDEIDNIVVELDNVHNLLNDSITYIDTTLPKLDQAIIEINKLAAEIDKTITQFSQFDESSAEQLVNPINTEFSPVLGDLEKIHLIFPILLVFVITFISILLSNMVVLNEIHNPAYFRNFLLPINNLVFIIGLYITNMIVIAIQLFVLLLVAYFNFHIDVFSIFPQLAFAMFLVTTVFVLIGMILGYIIPTRQSSVIMCTFLALGIFLFSDVIFPVEIMPELAAYLANLNPLLVGENLFRKIIFFHIPYSELGRELIVLGSFIALLAIATVLAYYKNKSRR